MQIGGAGTSPGYGAIQTAPNALANLFAGAFDSVCSPLLIAAGPAHPSRFSPLLGSPFDDPLW